MLITCTGKMYDNNSTKDRGGKWKHSDCCCSITYEVV